MLFEEANKHLCYLKLEKCDHFTKLHAIRNRNGFKTNCLDRPLTSLKLQFVRLKETPLLQYTYSQQLFCEMNGKPSNSIKVMRKFPNPGQALKMCLKSSSQVRKFSAFPVLVLLQQLVFFACKAVTDDTNVTNSEKLF